MKLGEFFIQRGVINQAQLEQALKAQLIFGGHLGTCLMELGHVDEQRLGETLAEIFKVPYVPQALLDNVSRSVIELMPARLVEKHHAVPFQKSNRMLHLAMIDPKNLPALDEISFFTGCKVEPWVAPEARIFQVMERYYDIPRRQRYIAVCQDMDRSPAKPAAPRSGLASVYAPPPYLASVESVPQPPATIAPDVAPPSVALDVAPPAVAPAPAPRAAAPQAAPPVAPPVAPIAPPIAVAPPVATLAAVDLSADRPLHSAVDFSAEPARPAAREKPRRQAAPVPKPIPKPIPEPMPDLSDPLASEFIVTETFTQESFSNRLCDAETAEDLARCFLEYASRGLERCALFLVKSTTATLWCSRGMEREDGSEPSLSLSVTSDPLFELLLERDHYRGRVPEEVGLRASFKAMRIEVPSELILVPGYDEDRLVVLLYGDGGVNGTIRGDSADYRATVKKLACALHLVTLKRRIRAQDHVAPTADPAEAA
jgi:hypothetical protein